MPYVDNGSDDVVPVIRQALLSTLVIVSFAGYTLYERLVNPADADAATATASDSPFGSRPSAQLSPTPSKAPASGGGAFRDGQYLGSVADAYFGNVQVKATIQSGRITDVQFVDYPHDRRTSQRINQIANPMLKSEAIQAQRANVNIISGATLTSEAFIQSLQAALAKARG